MLSTSGVEVLYLGWLVVFRFVLSSRVHSFDVDPILSVFHLLIVLDAFLMHVIAVPCGGDFCVAVFLVSFRLVVRVLSVYIIYALHTSKNTHYITQTSLHETHII